MKKVISLMAAIMILTVSVFAIENVPPRNPPFIGSGYVSGYEEDYGTLTIYMPISYQDGYLGVDNNGYLYNVSSSSITCYIPGFDTVNIPAFSLPRYRDGNYNYTNLYLTPEYSNMVIATEFPSQMSFVDLAPYFSLLLLGVIFVCFMRRS